MKSSDDALLAGWGATLRGANDSPAIYDTHGEVARTFGQIEEAAHRFAANLLAPFAAGEVVALQIGSHVDWPALFLACLRRGIVALPLERTMARSELESALQICRASAVVETTTDQIDSAIRVRALTRQRVEWDGLAPALLKLTSGTTAAPRAIRFRSDQLRADADQICTTMEITNRDLNFAGIPLSHSYGFSNLITPLIARAVPMVLSRDRMPRAVLDDLARTEATVFPGMPVFYQAFCEMDRVPKLPKLRLCISAGAPLPSGLAQKFRQKFGQVVHSFYGSSECGGICYDRVSRIPEDGFVGDAMANVAITLLEPNAGMSQVEVRSPAVGDGYFPEPEKEKLTTGRFVPDDLLRFDEDGFRIVGRVSDVINVAGKKVHPAEVEAVLLAFAGVREAVAFGRRSALRNEEVAACVVTDASLTETELLRFCRQRLSGWQVPKRVVFLSKIPVTERGKISRRLLAERFSS